ncbi:flagellar hook-basal body complex protein [Reinekea thalattae]|uniref:Flagellar hook protein FlgE n=1 Tax=Reinekea thalattae TaxID=2593301 RepID=A0A5C8Z8Q4_9GAMM|nr:flagellar hook-basal body complex protein [Reinekea thalattae]TXR53236.1 flagellar hook-basal body complex protein [Reinekea thalattae]
MSFSIGLSGVSAANTDLSVTGNNIANASTTGFKSSRTEFGDAYTSSLLGMGQDIVGSGVSVTNIGQKFNQGSITQTDSALDLAIDGDGFFVTEYDNGEITYTRSGIFGLDEDGYVVSNSGATLQGYSVANGEIVTGVLTDLQVDSTPIAPQRTTDVDMAVDIPSNAEVLVSEGSITTTDGLAVGVVQAGPEEDTATTLNSISYPTTAGTASELAGGPITGIVFPWQPTTAQASMTLDVSLYGVNIDTDSFAVTANIQPFSDDTVYNDVNDIVSAINSAIEGSSEIAGKIEASVNEVGGISFQTVGTYATDGTSIVSVDDNVGTLSSSNFLNFSDFSYTLQGSSETGLEIVSTATFTTLTSGRELSGVDTSSPYLDAYIGETIDFNVSVGGTIDNISVTIPPGGFTAITDLVTALNTEFTAAGANVTATNSGDTLVFTSTVAGDVDLYFYTDTSSTSAFDAEDLGFLTSSSFTPTTVQGIDVNDTLVLDYNGTTSGTDTFNITPGSYANADDLVTHLNSLGSTEIQFYAIDEVLYVTRLDTDTTASVSVDTLLSTNPGYFGLDPASAEVITAPTSVTPIAGTDLFADDGFIDLSSFDGVATSIEGNTTAGTSYNNFSAGTYSVYSAANPNSLGDIDTILAGDASPIEFTITIGSTTHSISYSHSGAGTYASQAAFAADLEAQIETTFGADLITVAFDGDIIEITSNNVGPVNIEISDISGHLTNMALTEDANPDAFLQPGTNDIEANNVLEITIDGGNAESISIPEDTYSIDDLVDVINEQINANAVLANEVVVTEENGRLVFTRTEVGDYPLELEITGTTEALEAFGLDSQTETAGEDPIDRSHSFTINLDVPDPDEDGRSGSVTISLDEVIYSIDQLAASINRELASVEESEYIGVQAVVETDEDGNEYLTLVATVEGEESTISLTNITATGDDLDVNALYGLLQADEYDSDLLEIGEAATDNGYPEQTFELYNEADGTTETIVIPEASSAAEIAGQLSDLAGVTATAETNMTLVASSYINSGDMDLYVNGQVIESDDFDDIVDEINSYSLTTLNGITAALDEETGNITITSATGIDLNVGIESDNPTDSITVEGTDGYIDVTLGGDENAETYAVVGGSVEIILNEGFSMSEPDPRLTGLFNGLTDASFEPYTINEFDPDDSETYNETSSMTVYDSLGNDHEMQLYYVKNAADASELSSWTVYVRIDGEDVGDPDTSLDYPENLEPTYASFELYFNADGTVNEEDSGEFLITNWDPLDQYGEPTGAYTSVNIAEGASSIIDRTDTNSNFSISFGGTTQYDQDFFAEVEGQDGYASGQLSDLYVGEDGTIYATYTNGETDPIGQVAIASFTNNEGLTPSGDTEWVESVDSGEPSIGVPGTGTLGTLVSAALEESTVELSEELVNLIIAQRNYQASAKTIETANEVTQTIINL